MTLSPVTADLVAFTQASPTPYHAARAAIDRLVAAGFREKDERDEWSGLPPGRYFVVRGGTAVIAFAWGGRNAVRGFRVVGAHTDSPNLRLKPKPIYEKNGYLQVGVEVYGGALLNSWLDRDLSLAGRVLVRGPAGLEARLVRIDRPICRVAQLAIHLDRDVNDKGLVLNRQEHLPPILGLAGASLPSPASLVAGELGVAEDQIAGLDLHLFDVNPPTVGGLHGELVFSPRLDNQAMCHAGVTALVDGADEALAAEVTPVVALFDHEEIGSGSAVGAAGTFLPVVLERLSLAAGKSRAEHLQALAASFCVSADMAHALHPNYPDRHEARHRPMLNAGPVIKVNAQQRYATCAATAALFESLAKAVDVPVQHYAHRTDLPCGTTIGPITSTLLGIRTVDVGNPMLSMHSARELAGAADPPLMTRVLARFFATRDET